MVAVIIWIIWRSNITAERGNMILPISIIPIGVSGIGKSAENTNVAWQLE